MAKAQMPLSGLLNKDWKVTSFMGWRIHPVKKTKKHHNGTDIIYTNNKDNRVYAPYAGTVTYAGPSKTTQNDGEPSGFGYYVKITHKINEQFYSSLYAHLVKGSMKVKQGDKVGAGDILGIMGTSGMSTGIHLHWEIWKGKSHGWTEDGKGFVEPIEFMKALINLEGAAEYAEMASEPSNKASSPKTPGATAKPIEVTPRLNNKPATKPPQKSSGAHKKTHKVVSGDTLSKIAIKYKTSVEKLVSLNKLKTADHISVGQTIKLL
jgi:murein DD-endopeptidase MepM/ murein hydrolase activator NlpD